MSELSPDQNRLLDALEQTMGIVTAACQATHISRATHYRWIQESDEYAERVNDIKDISLDMVESALFKKIRDGDTASILFYLKCKGRGRGYIEDNPTFGIQVPIINITPGVKISNRFLPDGDTD